MPEHVSIEYDHPGKCAICGMTLVPGFRGDAAQASAGRQAALLHLPHARTQRRALDKPGKCPKCGMTLIPVMEAPPSHPEERGERERGEHQSVR